MNKTVAIIGAGRVGSSVGFLLARAGYAVIAVATTSTESAEKAAAYIGVRIQQARVQLDADWNEQSDIQSYHGCGSAADAVRSAGAGIVFITTPDRSIREVCEEIARSGGLKSGAIVLHMSGAHSLDLLDAAREAGAYRAVIHPLQSVPSMEQGVKNLPGSSFRIEADPGALQTARDLVRALGGIELAMPKWKSDQHSAALYHAGAVAVSNFFVALVDYGLMFFETLGADRREALKAALPLIKGTLSNIETLGIPAALTGPIVRGDAETVRGHLEAMRARAPELLDLYRALARQTIAVARERGLTGEKAEELISLLKI